MTLPVKKQIIWPNILLRNKKTAWNFRERFLYMIIVLWTNELIAEFSLYF